MQKAVWHRWQVYCERMCERGTCH